MRIYVATSWKNPRIDSIIASLTNAGHDIYDFRHPEPKDHGFQWVDILKEVVDDFGPVWQKRALEHPTAEKYFKFDYVAMQWADACVMIQPCGVSAAIELGWFAGRGKLALVLLDDGKPELMTKVGTLCTTIYEVLDHLERWR